MKHSIENIAIFFDELMSGSDSDLLSLLDSKTPLPKKEGVQVYYSNALEAVVSALKAHYPVAQTLLGEKYFRQCALKYIEEHPLNIQDLNLYGESFPMFMEKLVSQKDELKTLGYLESLCRLEWGVHQAYYAHDRRVFEAEKLSEMREAEQINVRFQLSGDVSVLSSSYNIKELYLFYRNKDNAHKEFEISIGEYFFLIERAMNDDGFFEIAITDLELSDFNCIQAISEGRSFGEICEEFSVLKESELKPPPLGSYISKGWVDGFISDT